MLGGQGQHLLEIPGGQGWITRAKCHGARQVQPVLGRQLRPFGFNMTGIGQAAQVFHQHLLLSGKSRLLGLIPQRYRVSFIRVVGASGDVLQPVDGMAEAADLEAEVAFRQFRQRLATVIQQAHGKVRAAGQRRTQRQA
ncbi:hypothetical protein D3C78_1537790 [compost metagenome]